MSTKPSIPKGTRDFLPKEARKRNYIFSTIQKVFEAYGYEPVETPAMELLSTLTGKYGEEGDRLIFNIMPRGQKLDKMLGSANTDGFKTSAFVEEALRYDLTVPFARMVVQHQNDITFPFKRYQIQPVWRADRPQRGRYREFYQCDVDVIGSTSLLNELELIQIIQEVFANLQLLDVTIKLNNRKILAGIAEFVGHPDKLIDITIAIDKIDKIGLEKVKAELEERGIDEDAVTKLEDFLLLNGSNDEKLKKLSSLLSEVEIAGKGVEEARFVLEQAKKLNINNVELDISLARGLNYYTGAIFEVVTADFPSSICGGGRYDDLTGIFGLKDVSGVGISFGADRIYDVMEDRKAFPQNLDTSTQVMFVNFGEAEALCSLELAKALRNQGVSSEVFPDASKMKKQFKYANDKNIPLVLSIGSNEMETGRFKLKNMLRGEELDVTKNNYVEEVLKVLSTIE